MTRARAAAVGIAVGCVVAAAACGFDETVLRDPIGVTPDADGMPEGATLPATDARPGSGVSGVFAGQYFTCALTTGKAFCWGSNVDGALGTGDLEARLTPAAVATGVAFETLAPGEAHVCGIEASAGRVLCWGSGAKGRLGTGDETRRPTPEVVQGIPGAAVRIGSGYQHTCIVSSDGSLWCWGANDEGQLGQSDPIGNANALRPVRVGTESDWLEVAGGQGHTCALRRPGTLWCWGRNVGGELGLGSGQPGQIRTPMRVGAGDDWVALDVGQDEACALRRDGSLWCWGNGGAGELAPVDAADPTLWSPTQIGGGTDWTAVSTDVFTTCGLKKNGALFCWGRNVEGQLGTGDNADRTMPTATGLGSSWAAMSVGRLHVCAETTTHVVRCAGKNDSGELGIGTTARRNFLTDVALPEAR